MAKDTYTTEELLKMAADVRDEFREGHNTALRIGTLFMALINHIVDGSSMEDKFLRKDQEDTTRFLVNFLAGLRFMGAIQSTDFNAGPLGTGVIIRTDPETGRSYIEVDELFVRIKAIFTELEIRKLSYAGGNWIFSAAGGKCLRVEELEDVYRCYLHVDDGEVAVENEFRVGDQVRCQEFKIKPGVHQNVASRYYWRLVTAVGDDYIDLSKTDCDASSDAPKAGDAMVQLGHRTDPQRQNAIIISAYGEGSPSITQHAGIKTYALGGTEKTRISPTKNVFTGEFHFDSGVNVETEMSSMRDEIKQAAQQASNAITAAGEAQDTVKKLDKIIEDAFADGKITEVESTVIRRYLNIIDNNKKSVEATYLQLYTNPYLSGTPKDDLMHAKVTFMGSVEDLINAVNTAILDNKTTPEESADVDAKFAAFNTAYADFCAAVEAANKAIQDALKDYTTEQVGELKTYTTSQIQALGNQISLKVDSNTFNELNQKVTSQSSEIELLKVSITSVVTKTEFNQLSGSVTTLQSTVKQQADQISLKITKSEAETIAGNKTSNLRSEIKSSFSMATNGISLLGTTIRLTGCVTFDSLSSSVENKLNTAANDASTAKTDAYSAKTAASDAKSAASSANSAASSASTKAKDAYDKAVSAYNKKIGLSDLNTTIIDGGNVLTQSIIVKKINAVTGKIGAFDINSTGLTNETSSPTAYISLGDSSYNFVRINKSSESALIALRCQEKFSVGLSVYTQSYTNTAISATAQTGAVALKTAGTVYMYQRDGERWNVPGVLWAAKIDYRNGGIYKYWGHGLNGQQSVTRNGKGSFRVYHYLGRLDYFPFLCCEGNGNWPVGFVGNLQSNYFDVSIIDSNNGLTDAHFFVMVCGRNKW